MRQFVFDDKIIVKFLDPGTYKGELIIYKKQEEDISSMTTFTARLY